jgi:hypothetical protein
MSTKTDHAKHVEADVDGCTVVRLAQGELIAVDRCSCGTLRVHLGPMTLRVNAAGLSAIVSTLNEALMADASFVPRPNLYVTTRN